jgi:hypothetical protein
LGVLVSLTSGAQSSRTLCYAGSSMYQSFIQDCDAADSTYTGTWYCAEIEVCESFMSGSRECITTKGCAKEAQCYDTGDSSTGTLYSGTSLSNAGSQLPAGMTLSPSCCLNQDQFSDDDTALDYSTICNDAARSGAYSSMWLTLSIGIAAYFYIVL